MLDQSIKKEQFIRNIDISSDNFITLSSSHQLYMLGWGGIASFGSISEKQINAFSYTPEGLLMVVKQEELCFLNEAGTLEKLIELPSKEMNITAGNNVMYLFDQHSNTNYKLYAYAKGGKHKQLIQSPKPINAVAELKDAVYVAIGSAVFSFTSNEENLNLVTAFPKENKVISMTADPDNQILYISTLEGIYALQHENLVYLTADFKATIIKYFKGGLVVFNPETNDIMRIVHINNSIKF